MKIKNYALCNIPYGRVSHIQTFYVFLFLRPVGFNNCNCQLFNTWKRFRYAKEKLAKAIGLLKPQYRETDCLILRKGCFHQVLSFFKKVIRRETKHMLFFHLFLSNSPIPGKHIQHEHFDTSLSYYIMSQISLLKSKLRWYKNKSEGSYKQCRKTGNIVKRKTIIQIKIIIYQ